MSAGWPGKVRLASDKVRKRDRDQGCRELSRVDTEGDDTSIIAETSCLQLEVSLHELAELVAVFVFHVHKFDSVAFGTDIADDGSEVDFAQAGADFQSDGIAHIKFAR